MTIAQNTPSPYTPSPRTGKDRSWEFSASLAILGLVQGAVLRLSEVRRRLEAAGSRSEAPVGLGTGSLVLQPQAKREAERGHDIRNS